MDEYVKRSDVINSVCQFCKDQHKDELCDQWDVCQLFTRIANVPPADVVERKRGKWIYQPGGISEFDPGDFFICSECDCATLISSDFCPNCGAYMRG